MTETVSVQNPNTPTSPFRNKTTCTMQHIGAGLSFYAMARRAKLRSRSLSKSQSALHACQKECDWLLVRQMGVTRIHGRAMCTYLISTPWQGTWLQYRH
ncbi:hypothetical protein NC653_026664 [Populus alba x Populus x berolinensis]|uniref:Uncharacterized protein n=1 Tax=Populus alba x Populus x berolinensis TaxID=444605 RepID=A0AAD6MEL2_9ROSI|nr:hypothetical protein NC653_026664 [Populus alba x Populus x berolinensis]